MLVEPAEVKLHLPLVCSLELPDFQLHGYQPAQLAIVEQQVDEEVFVVDLDALLTSNEGEARSQLQ